MKRVLYSIFGFFMMLSCTNQTETKVTDQELADTIVENTPAPASTAPYSVEHDESTQGLSLVRSNEDLSNTGISDILRVINAKYDGIKLDLVRSSADTVNLKIDDASKLTQEMGSAGAEAYLAEVTFSLTELKGVKAVRVEFEEGDHAMPGVYTRAYFKSVNIRK